MGWLVGTKSCWNGIPINCGFNLQTDLKKEQDPKMEHCAKSYLAKFKYETKFMSEYQFKIEIQFQSYPWCGYCHLFFDTIVKPLEKEKESYINGAFMSRNLLAIFWQFSGGSFL